MSNVSSPGKRVGECLANVSSPGKRVGECLANVAQGGSIGCLHRRLISLRQPARHNQKLFRDETLFYKFAKCH